MIYNTGEQVPRNTTTGLTPAQREVITGIGAGRLSHPQIGTRDSLRLKGLVELTPSGESVLTTSGLAVYEALREARAAEWPHSTLSAYHDSQ